MIFLEYYGGHRPQVVVEMNTRCSNAKAELYTARHNKTQRSQQQQQQQKAEQTRDNGGGRDREDEEELS